MFSIRLSPPVGYVPPEGEPNLDMSTPLSVKDHSALEDHLDKFGVKLEPVNFFKWEALPARSYGRFLVSEREWLVVANKHKGDLYVELTISDGLDTKVFYNLDVVSTSFVMSPLSTTGVLGQDGSRLLILELELSNRIAHESNRSYEINATSYVFGASSNPNTDLAMSDVVMYRRIPSVPKIEYSAYLSSLNFLTLYMPSGQLNELPSSMQARRTNLKFTFPTNKQMLYNKVSVTKGPIDIKIVIPSDDWCKNQFYDATVSVEPTSEVLYITPVNSTTKREEITVVLNYTMVDHLKVGFNSSHGNDEATRIANILKTRANIRLYRDVDVLYQGLVTGDISNDVQRITYSFEGSRLGLRTRLESIPWKVNNAILDGTSPPEGLTSLYWGVLLSNMPNGISPVFTMEIENNGYRGLQEYESVVKDKLGIFSSLKAGDKVLLEKDTRSCDYYIVNSQCPSTTPPGPPPPVGSCCVPVFPTTAGHQNSKFLACYDGVTQSQCAAMQGSWTAGGTCANPPICPQQ